MSERVKFQIEYLLSSSPEFLFNYISTPTGLSAWFADDVTLNGDIFTFVWEGSEEKAKLIKTTHNKYVKFKWIEREDEFFTFEVFRDEMTGEVALIITDFEDADQVEEAKMVYNGSMKRLHQTIG